MILLVSVMISYCSGQKFFAEEWFDKSPLFDELESGCQKNDDCKFQNDVDKGIVHKCALVEMYSAASISISEFV